MRAISSRKKTGAGVILAVLTIALAMVVPQSQATFPGQNGLLAWIQDGDLWTAFPDGSSPAKLVDEAADPAWSADGAWLLFDRGGDIFKVLVNGTLVTRLTNDAADDVEAAWSPDGARVVFASNRVGGRYRLYRMNADGSDVVALTTGDGLGPGTDDGTPEWSPDGARIVFHRGNGLGGARIHSMNADGTDVAPLTGTTSPDGLPYDDLFGPKWSPGGGRIVFATGGPDCTPRVFMMNSNGSNPVALPKNGGCVAGEPTWSPDGAIVLFRLTGVASGAGLYGYRVVENQIAKLVDGAGAAAPDWQPGAAAPGTSSSTSTVPPSSTSTVPSSTTSTTIAPVPVSARSLPLVVRSGKWFLRNTATTGPASNVFDYGNPTGDVPVTGDWDGNGSATPGVVRNGVWFLRNSNSTGVANLSFAYGDPGDRPVTGDWDGNGSVTPGVWRNGVWYLRNSNTTGVADFTFGYGDPADFPITGDWDGNGTVTPGVVRQGIWYLRNSNTTGVADATFAYGNPDDVPIPGDWDGNGSSTPGVVRGAIWYVRNANTTGIADSTFGYGDPHDRVLTWRNA